MPRVSVVIVSYNTRELLRRCLKALPHDFEAVVVDNASSDGSADTVSAEFFVAKLIRNVENRGFGAANNQGMDAASGELVLFLNSDAYPKPGAVERLTKVFEDEKVIAGGGKLVNPDGSLQQSSANRLTLWAVFCEQSFLEKLFPSSGLLSPYWNSLRFSETAEVAQVMGACLMMRRDAARFDERFFLYCEDTELCRRLLLNGKILYVPEAEFVHELGSSSSGRRWEAVALYNRGKELYFQIHHGTSAAAFCFLLNRAGALARFAVWGIAAFVSLSFWKTARHRAGLFCRVLTAPRKGPKTPLRRLA